MKYQFSIPLIGYLLFLCMLVYFLAWYRGPAEPLTRPEIVQYLAQLEDQPSEALAFLDVDQIRGFLQNDDGAPFYMVNLFKFAGEVPNPNNPQELLSGKELFDLFSRSMLPIWARHGSHPVFASSFTTTAYGEWNFVSIVRYRSRRDFAEVQTDADFLAVLPLRIAAALENERFKVAGNPIPLPLVLLLVIMVLGGLLITLLVRKYLGRPVPLSHT